MMPSSRSPSMNSVAIPDGLTAECVRGLIAAELLRVAKDQERARTIQDVLESDEAMQRWADRNIRVPVVRAESYDVVEADQEIHPFRHSFYPELRDPRRPVAMKGGRGRLIWGHSFSGPQSPNGWCYAVAERYLKMSKFTGLDIDTICEKREELTHYFYKKYGVSYHFDNHLEGILQQPRCWNSYAIVWVNGKHFYAGEDRIKYLRALYKIINKFDCMDDRYAALKAWRRNHRR